MKTNLLNRYITARLNNIEQNIFFFSRNKDTHYLHLLRVEIKKIKALFSFANQLYNEQNKIAKLKPLFHHAGRIREIQINIRLLDKLPGLPERIILDLKQHEKKELNRFVKNIPQYIQGIKKFSREFCLPETLPGKKVIKKYFSIKKHQANKKFERKTRTCMHSYRARIKKLLYIYNALPKKLREKIALNKNEIDKEQKKLGNWHDTYISLEFLSHHHPSEISSPYILFMKKKENRQFNALFRK